MTDEQKPTTALVPHKPGALNVHAFEPSNFSEAFKLVALVSASPLIPSSVRNKPHDILLITMRGRELGWTFMRSLAHINVIEGKPTIDASGLVGLCCEQRNICEYFMLVESTAVQATYETRRKGHPSPVRMTYTMEQAQAAGLAGKKNWQRMPAEMLRARASTALARAVYPDVIAGMYASEEMGDVEPGGPVPELPPQQQPGTVDATDVEELPPDPGYNPHTGEVYDEPPPEEQPSLVQTEQKPPKFVWGERFAAATTTKELADIRKAARGAHKDGELSDAEMEELEQVATDMHGRLKGKGSS